MATLDDPKVRAALDEGELPRMSFGDHLDELRSRLVKALLAVVVAVVGVMPWKTQVQELIITPYRAMWRDGFADWAQQLEAKAAAIDAAGGALDKHTRRFLDNIRSDREMILAGTHPYPAQIPIDTGYPVPYTLFSLNGLEDTMAWMWAALVFALVLAAPVVIWQLWAFIAAGLYKHERTIFYRYFPFMLVLLVSGVLFGYFVALPYTLRFLVTLMDPSQVGAMFGIGQFLTLLFFMTGALGLLFQLPLVMVALQRVGLVSHRAFRKHWRMTILIIAIVAAVVTPPDPVSMTLTGVPMVLLYGLGLLLTWFNRRRDAAPVPVHPA
jgi:sec-independent protein translocase protein TatC